MINLSLIMLLWVFLQLSLTSVFASVVFEDCGELLFMCLVMPSFDVEVLWSSMFIFFCGKHTYLDLVLFSDTKIMKVENHWMQCRESKLILK